MSPVRNRLSVFVPCFDMHTDCSWLPTEYAVMLTCRSRTVLKCAYVSCCLQIFGKLMEQVDEAELSAEEAKERKIMKLLLKVKNGTPPQRKSALRQLTEKARDFGAKALFDQILPLLMTPTLEDQERHLLVKVIDR